ncbi:MAG: glycoside hydrolase family 32 protein [Gemmatimonadota bacterium]
MESAAATLEGGQSYRELHRPQFHFTPRRDWMNDPNGLVWYGGEYHLFFQHSPGFVTHAPNTWGHAVSPDLVHWQQLDHAIEPDEYGFIWSGSAVVDWRDTAGFRRGDEAPIVAIYTTGGFGDPPTPCVQAIAYSTDRGRTFARYSGNPVLGHLRAANRDPRVIWHEPTGRWVMALYLDGSDFALLASPDLKSWQPLCEVTVEGTGECPDLFELPVDGDPADTRWVFWGAAGVYRLGTFDGRTFVPQTPAVRCELGANGYAAQTWSDVPAEDGRCLQISWMAGGQYPDMPFNQQLSIPVALSLRTTREGVRLCRQPVREVEGLRRREHAWDGHLLQPGPDRRALFVRHGPGWRDHVARSLAPLVVDTTAELFDICAEVEVRDAEAFGMRVRGHDLWYDRSGQSFTCLGRQVPVPLDGQGRLRFRVLVDQTSLELFARDGEVSASFCYLPGPRGAPLEFYARGGPVRLVALRVHELASAWR